MNVSLTKEQENRIKIENAYNSLKLAIKKFEAEHNCKVVSQISPMNALNMISQAGQEKKLSEFNLTADFQIVLNAEKTETDKKGKNKKNKR